MLSDLDFDNDAEVPQAAQQAVGELPFVSVDKVATATMAFLGPAAVLHTQELRLEIAPLLASRGPRGLDEGRLQPGCGMAIRVERRFPALSSRRGQSPAQETR